MTDYYPKICTHCGKQLTTVSEEQTKTGTVTKLECNTCNITYKVHTGKVVLVGKEERPK